MPISPFSTLQLHAALLQALNEKNYSAPTAIQQQAIPSILSGKDIMARAQTGTGKTAAFALPILDLLLSSPEANRAQSGQRKDVRALVLVPTRELAQQVHASINEYGKHTEIDCTCLYGGISLKPQIEALNAGTDIVVATPGRLLDLMAKSAIHLTQIRTLVFDEADRMLDMGFKDEIKRIMRRLPSTRQTLLFSATFDQQVKDFSRTLLINPEFIEVDDKNTAAAQVEQRIYAVDADRKRELISFLIGSQNWHQVLIFTRTKDGADALAKEMGKDGITTQSIHGDKSQGARERALTAFKQGKARALVATDVAARGLDISDLNYVINYELPYIAEDYIHRIGRTGRAGNSGLAISLVSAGEEWLLEEIEALLDQRLPQQWLAGYEPDLTKPIPTQAKNTKRAQKQRVKQRAQGRKTGNRRR